MKRPRAKTDRYIFLLFPTLALWWFQVSVWQSFFLGVCLYAVYLWIVGVFWQNIFHRVYFFKKNTLSTYIYAVACVSALVGYGVGIAIVWYRLTPGVLFWVLPIVAVLSYTIDWLTYGKKMKKRVVQQYDIRFEKFRPFRISSWICIVYALGWVGALSLLGLGESSDVLETPWQAISPYYPYLLFVLSGVLGVILVGRFKSKALLFFVVLHSILMHAYLPFSHVLPWGGDVWRTIGIEQKIATGEPIYPVLFGDQVEWGTVGPFDVPKIFLAPHKYVYAHVWGTTLFLSEAIGVSLIDIQIWLVPIFWSLFLPLIFFRMGLLLFGSSRYGVWFSAATLIPFSFQAVGGLTLAISLGSILFFFTLMLWLQYVRERVPWQRTIAIGFALLLFFGHSIYAFLMWALIGVTWALFSLEKVSSSLLRKSVITVLGCLSICVLPVIELVARTSFVPAQFSFIDSTKQYIGQLSGWFYASHIRPHNIISGNIFFNHTPEWAFVEHVFTMWRYHIMFFMLVIAFGIFVTWVHIIFEERRKEWYLLAFLFLISFGGYSIGWFVFDGDRSLVRRLDPTLAYVCIVFAAAGWHIAKKKIGWAIPASYRLVSVFMIIFFFSWTSTTIAMSGPHMRVLSKNEYQAVQYLYQEVKKEENVDSLCVVADTWPLLALEAISSSDIVGGGFPIDYQFAQPERVVLYRALLDDPRASIFTLGKEITGASFCHVLVETKDWSEEKKAQLSEIIHEPAYSIGSILVGKERLKTSQ